MKKRRFYTKRAMDLIALRLPGQDRKLWRAAAAMEEISQSEFLRRAIAERVKQVMGTGENRGSNV